MNKKIMFKYNNNNKNKKKMIRSSISIGERKKIYKNIESLL